MDKQIRAEIPSHPSLYKISYFSENNNPNTRSICKFISEISFSFEITIKESTAITGGHFKPGSTIGRCNVTF